ncbi:MAG: 23S rRNA pseudouridine2457 synthase [Bacteriovoracaceae bacterium]|jgi:23S rRNA pseudouridine2457 synthase
MAMEKYKYIAFFKPFGVLTQFTGEESDLTLSDYNFPANVYAAGRLDKDSEGLLILTDDGVFNQRLTNPSANKKKTYWVQVDKIPSEDSLNKMRKGLKIKDYITRPCLVKIISEPHVPPREPPIRVRKNIPTSWLEITLSEGKNRQVRRMTAKIGHPTLRLIRATMGKCSLKNLAPGEWKEINKNEIL